MQIRVTVLHINPTTKVLSLSELTHLVTPDLAPLQLFGGVKLGTVLDEAVVTRVDCHHGVYFRLPDKQKAFASVSVRCRSTVINLLSLVVHAILLIWRLLSTHVDKQGVDISFTVCNFVCLFVRSRISPPRIKLAASNFARRFIGVQGRESHILGNFAPPEAQIRQANELACALNYK